MKQKVIRYFSVGALGTVALASLWIGFLRWAPAPWLYSKQFRISEELIETVDAFQAVYNRTPSEQELLEILSQQGKFSLSERCPCYRPLTKSTYQVWFGYQSVGTSMVYHSDSQTWQKQK
ncbi:MAG: hypothetical protein AAGL08_10065 [Cyanobacteria bacterium J06573_11]